MKPAHSVDVGDYPRSLSWSADGVALAVGLADGTCVVVRPGHDVAPWRWKAHAMGLGSAAWSSVESRLATAGEDGRVRLWLGPDARAAGELDAGRGWVLGLSWSPEGRRLAAAVGKSVKLWTADGQPLRAGVDPEMPGTVAGLAWSPDAKRLAAVCYGRIRVLALEDGLGEEDTELDWKSAYVSVAWSPDGRHLAAGTQESSVVFWRVGASPGAPPSQMTGYAAKVTQVAWDTSSRYLATAGGSAVTLWDTSGEGPEGRTPQELEGHDGRISALAWQPKGQMLATGGRDGLFCLWNPRADGKGWILRKAGTPVTAVAWAPAGRSLAMADESGQVLVYS